MSNPSEWMQIHFNDVNRNQLPPPQTTTTAVITTTTATTSLDQGRVARPIRPRSRASRRTPTTLLNTDTTNFRAMVQHFTGSPSTTTYAATSQPSNAPGLYDFTQHATTASASPASGLNPVQYPNQIQQQHMLMIDNMVGRAGSSSHAPPESSSKIEGRDYDNYMF